MTPCIWLRAYASGRMALGIWLRAYGSGSMAPGIGRQAYGSGRMRGTLRVQRLEAHDMYVGDPKVFTPVCAQHLLNGEVCRCVLWIAICYENDVCATLAGKLVVKRLHVQRLVNRGIFLKQAPALKPCCE